MSGAHCLEQKLEGVWCHSLHAPSIPTLLQEYQELLQRLLGPKAGITLVHHIGGLDSFINSSSELVKRIQPHHPCIKFINSLMEAQNCAYGCLGLYVGVLCSSLLKELLQLEYNCDEGLTSRAVKEAANILMAQILAYLDTEPENIVNKLDLSNLNQMLGLVGTTLGSKNFCLNYEEKQHLKVKVVEAFLATIPSTDDEGLDAFGDVIVTVVEGRPATEAQVFEGVLYREQHPNEKVIDAIKQRRISSHTHRATFQGVADNSNLFLSKGTSLSNGGQNQVLRNANSCRAPCSVEFSLNDVPESPYPARVSNRLAVSKYTRYNLDNVRNICTTADVLQQPSNMRVILFNVPLVFEQSETECLKFTDGASNSEVYDRVMIAKLRALVRRHNIDVITCQKVVSEVVKFELRREGVLVLERLGTALTASLERLTGCVPISDVSFLPPTNKAEDENNEAQNNELGSRDVDTFCNGFMGTLTDLTIVEVNGKTYLQLENNQCRTRPEARPADQADVAKGFPVVTFLLPALSSVTSESLKAVVEESLKVLRHGALHPLVAAAGGCFEAAVASWTANGGVMAAAGAVIEDHADGRQGLPPTATALVAKLYEAKIEEARGGTTVDEAMAAVDRLLLEEDDALEDSVPELQQRQVACVFAKVFVNMSVLQSQGSNASVFDFSIDTRTSHLIHDFASNVSCPQNSSSAERSSEDHSCSVRCSCRAVTVTSPSTRKETDFVDLRSLFELQPSLSQGPRSLHSLTKNIVPENSKTINAGKASDEVISSSSDTMKYLNSNGGYSLNKVPRIRVSPSYVFETTADSLVESYHAKVNAIRLAFEGVVQLLSVDYCVFDR